MCTLADAPYEELIAILQNNYVQLSSERKTPYIIAVSGGVAVGKSTFSERLTHDLKKALGTNKITAISTDNFLFPNNILEKENRMEEKGFPWTYQIDKLKKMMQHIKLKNTPIKIPVYDHTLYDIADYQITIPTLDVLIVEGINILQPDFLDDTLIDTKIFLYADMIDAEKWFFQRLHQKIHESSESDNYFQNYQQMTDKEIYDEFIDVWKNIDLENFYQYIQPSMKNADIIISKNSAHQITNLTVKKCLTTM